MVLAERVSSAIAPLKIGAGAKRSTKPIKACAKFANRIRHFPRPIALDPHGLDLADRADHPNKVFDALWAYLTDILDGDISKSILGGRSLVQKGGHLRYALAERMAWRAA